MTRRQGVPIAAAAVLCVLALGLGASVPPPYARPAQAPAAEAALVLSGDVDDLRVARAAALYAAGGVPRLLLTGSGIGGDAAESMRLVAMKLGVPSDAISLESSSRTTRDNLVRAAPQIRSAGWRRVALVTNDSHMGRASLAARRVLPEVAWILVPVADPGPRSRILRARLQEWAKLAWYAAHGWI